MSPEERQLSSWSSPRNSRLVPCYDRSHFVAPSSPAQPPKGNRIRPTITDIPLAWSTTYHGSDSQLPQPIQQESEVKLSRSQHSLNKSHHTVDLNHCSFVITEINAEDSSEVNDEELGAFSLTYPISMVGAEKFHEAFHQHHPEGLITVPGLKAVLSELCVEVTEEEISNTLKDLYPDALTSGDTVTYEKAEGIYLSFAHSRRQHTHFLHDDEHKGCVSHWLANLSDEKAMNILLVVVVVACAISALLAAGIAAILMVHYSVDALNKDMIDELAIMDELSMSFAKAITGSAAGDKLINIISALAVVAESSYTSLVVAEKRNLAATIKTMTMAVENWAKYQPAMQLRKLARTSRLWTVAASKACNASATCTAANASSPQLPSGCNVASGQQWVMGNASLQWQDDALGVDLQRSLHQFFARQNMPSTQRRSSFFLARYDLNGTVELLVTPQSCDAACTDFLAQSDSTFQRALAGETAVMETPGPLGGLVGFTPLGTSGLGLAILTTKEFIVQQMISRIANKFDDMNSSQGNITEELELFVGRTATQMIRATRPRFGTDCPGSGCLLPAYAKQALLNCTSGQMRTMDYRGTEVLVAYHCLANLNAVISMKVDTMDLEHLALVETMAAVDTRNILDTVRTDEFLVVAPNGGKTPAQVAGYADFTLVTKIKYPEACVNPGCKWNRESGLRALQNVHGVIDTVDYRIMPIKAALSILDIAGGIGVILEVDTTEFNAPIIATILAIFGFAIGVTIIFTAVLIVVTKRSLRFMVQAQEESRRAVEYEKNQFSQVVASMYPAYVVPQLLAGEKENMVFEISNACVFFSDIADFTYASNIMNSEELVQLMGYVYGVMDTIAERYGVQKVKTIGDAYLAIAGLPGSETTNPSLDMLRFASSVAQVFSDRFHHPGEGQILGVMNQAMVQRWLNPHRNASSNSLLASARTDNSSRFLGGAFKRSNTRTGRLSHRSDSPVLTQRSRTPSGTILQPTLPRENSVSTIVTSDNRAQEKLPSAECIMSYGLAAGPVVAGVLNGRCPMFDIWGVTVNLASRMQSTSQPGRIQVSEQVHRQVISVAGQPFTFEAKRSTQCKGFGEVNAYFVDTTIEPIAEDLMDALYLKPQYDLFHFDFVLKDYRPSHASPRIVVSPAELSNTSGKTGQPRQPHHLAVMDIEDV